MSTVATPGEWQCKIRTGGVRRLAVANGNNIFQMLLVYSKSQRRTVRFGSPCIQYTAVKPQPSTTATVTSVDDEHLRVPVVPLEELHR